MSTIDDLTGQEQRLIAADFAERVLPLFEAEYPDDDRPRKAIDAARAYARGEITKEQMTAAGAAAWDAAMAAAGDAAWAAAKNAAWAAAWDAAGAAARDAAGDAAWAAAMAVAGAAAWDAARAVAGDAAGAAAIAVAGDAAKNAAAWDAAAWGDERAWQQQRIDEVVAARAQP